MAERLRISPCFFDGALSLTEATILELPPLAENISHSHTHSREGACDSSLNGMYTTQITGQNTTVWFSHCLNRTLSTYVIANPSVQVTKNLLQLIPAGQSLNTFLLVDALVCNDYDLFHRVYHTAYTRCKESLDRMDTPAPGGMPLMFRRKRRSKRDIDGVVQSFQRVYDVTRAYGNAMRILTLLREVMQSRVDLMRGTQKLLNNLEHNLVARQSAVRETLGMFSTIMDRKMAGFSSQLAEDARKDSSSMTTIALLTMFFLPGSVVASFFSTHFIRVIETQTETSSDGESVETRTKIKPLQVSSTIWVYFAVTAFLTLLVLSVWLYLHASIELPGLGIRGGDGGGDPRPWQPKGESKANADAKSEFQVDSEESEKKHGVEGDARVDVVEKLETSDPD